MQLQCLVDDDADADAAVPYSLAASTTDKQNHTTNHPNTAP